MTNPTQPITEALVDQLRARALSAQPAPAGEVALPKRFPMNTAPRDGTVIVLHWGEDGSSPGWWSAQAGFPWSFVDTDNGRHFVNAAVDTEYGPTSWSPYGDARAAAAASRPATAGPEGNICHIPAGDKLDPIIVYFKDEALGQGRMTIACYGDAWTAWWGGMGNRTVREFVAGVDAGYLCGALLQLRGASDSHRAYTLRIAARVISALSAAPQPAAAQDGDDGSPEVWINRCPVNHDRRATCPRCHSTRPPGAVHGQPAQAVNANPQPEAKAGAVPYADEMTNGECADKLQAFLDVTRENNPDTWPRGIVREVERAVYVLRNPPRTPFICECKRSPARGHNGRGGDGGNVLDKLLATVPMPDLPTTLRSIADRITVAANNPSHHGGHRGALDFVKREVGMLRIAADRVHDALSAQPKPADGREVAWIRFFSDGTYEGPIHDSQMDDIRRRSGKWTPLGVIGTTAARRSEDARPAPRPVPKCSRCGALTDLVCGSAECGNRNPSA